MKKTLQIKAMRALSFAVLASVMVVGSAIAWVDEKQVDTLLKREEWTPFNVKYAIGVANTLNKQGPDNITAAKATQFFKKLNEQGKRLGIATPAPEFQGAAAPAGSDTSKAGATPAGATPAGQVKDATASIKRIADKIEDVAKRIAKSSLTPGKAITNAQNLIDALAILNKEGNVAKATTVVNANFAPIFTALNNLKAKLDSDTRKKSSFYSNYPGLSGDKLTTVQTALKTLVNKTIPDFIASITSTPVQQVQGYDAQAISGLRFWAGPTK